MDNPLITLEPNAPATTRALSAIITLTKVNPNVESLVRDRPGLSEALYEGGSSICEISEDAPCWLVSSQQGGLVEKYLRGELCIALRRVEPTASENPKQNGFIIHALEAGFYSALPPWDVDVGNFRLHEQQPLMFSQDVELVEGVQKMVPSFVSLCAFDCGSLCGGYPLFVFHHCYGSQKISGALPNGEVGVAIRFYAIALNQSRHEQIEGRSSRINNCSGISLNQGIERNFGVSDQQFPVDVIRVRLFDDLVWAQPLPGYESLLQDWDLGVGPIDSGESV
jgi:hypothetical protein